MFCHTSSAIAFFGFRFFEMQPKKKLFQSIQEFHKRGQQIYFLFG